MWIFLWVVLSAILLGSTAWSLSILLRQKKAWEAFAKTHNFTFDRGTFMGPAEMSGVIGDYKLGFFTAERETKDARSRRYVTAIEIDLPEGVVNGAVMGTQEMLSFMQSIEKVRPYTIEGHGWEAGMYAFVRDGEAVKSYLTPERLEIFATLLKTRNADTLIVFHDTQFVVRLETSDPMQDADKIEKIVKRVIALVDKLRVSPEERAHLKALSAKD